MNPLHLIRHQGKFYLFAPRAGTVRTIHCTKTMAEMRRYMKPRRLKAYDAGSI